MKSVCVPNLPIGKVKLCAISADSVEVIAELSKLGVECLAVEPSRSFPKSIASHADLQVLHIGGRDIVCVENLSSRLKKYGFRTFVHDMGSFVEYPYHVDLCNLIVGSNCLCLKKNPLQDTVLKNFAAIYVKQGYVRCSVAVVTENAYMTSDVGIAEKLKGLGFQVLLLPSGDILLPPYEYGFIGGACGKLSKDTLAFSGSLEQYMYGELVKEFLKTHGVTPVYLTNGKLVDIGGIIPLAE